MRRAAAAVMLFDILHRILRYLVHERDVILLRTAMRLWTLTYLEAACVLEDYGIAQPGIVDGHRSCACSQPSLFSCSVRFRSHSLSMRCISKSGVI